MYRYPRRADLDLEPFRRERGPHAARYGLPHEVTFCRRCVISNQRPNSAVEYAHTSQSRKATIHLDEQGVCDACRLAEEKRRAQAHGGF